MFSFQLDCHWKKHSLKLKIGGYHVVCHPTTLVFIGAGRFGGGKELSIIYLIQCEKTKAKEGSGTCLKFTA